MEARITKEVGGDDPVFLGRQEDQEQEGVAGKGDHRDIIESAHQEPLLSQNPWEESRFSISWGRDSCGAAPVPLPAGGESAAAEDGHLQGIDAQDLFKSL